MKIRTQFIVYLAALHLACGAAVGYFLWQIQPYYILVIEVFVLCSFVMLTILLRRLHEPLALLQSSASMLLEADFSTTLVPPGHPEADAVTNVYNTMLMSLRDERVRTEEKGFLLQALINSSPTGILLCSEQLTVLALNPALGLMFAGFTAEAVQKPLATINSAFAECLRTMSFGGSVVLTHRFRRFKIRKVAFVERGMPHILVMVEELTAELQSSEKAVYERIIRVLSHEVNNSIGAARSLLESALFYDRYFVQDAPEGAREDFRDALTVASERLGDLGAFMREYALLVRLPAPKRVQIDVGELLNRMEKLFRELCRNKAITLLLHIPSELMMIYADTVQMQHVLTNLTKNAIEAMQSSREKVLSLSAFRRDSNVVIAIEDTGEGLSEKALTELQTPFFTTKETGQGIGLMLVRELVKAHGFEFHLENRSNGGAKAEIIIPIL